MDIQTLYEALQHTPITPLPYKRISTPDQNVDLLYVDSALFHDPWWVKLDIESTLTTSNYIGVAQERSGSYHVFDMHDGKSTCQPIEVPDPIHYGRLQRADAQRREALIHHLQTKKDAVFRSRVQLPELDEFIKKNFHRFHRDIDTVVKQEIYGVQGATETRTKIKILIPYEDKTANENKDISAEKNKDVVGLIYQRGGAKYIVNKGKNQIDGGKNQIGEETNRGKNQIDLVYIKIRHLKTPTHHPHTSATKIHTKIPYTTDCRYLYTENKTIGGETSQVAVFDMQAKAEVCPCCRSGRRRQERSESNSESENDSGSEVQTRRRVQNSTARTLQEKISVPQFLRSTPREQLKDHTCTDTKENGAKHLYIQVAVLKKANVEYLSDSRFVGKKLKRFADKAHYCAVFKLSD